MGKVICDYKISVALNMIAGSLPTQEYLDKTISLILAIMPEGTRHISTEQKSVEGLCIPFVLTFESSAYEDETKIELEYCRNFYYVDRPEGKRIVEFNQFVGINFFKPDGTPLYERWP